MIWGKILGGLIGIWWGPATAILGIVFGQIIDNYLVNVVGINPKRENARRVFFRVTFQIMGYIAKADGAVHDHEINVARDIMRNDMNLTPEQIREAIGYYTEGKQSWFRFDRALNEFINVCGGNNNLCLFFLDMQVKSAMSDGVIHPEERAILVYLCAKIRIPVQELEYKIRAHKYSKSTYTNTEQKSTSELDGAYKVLGIKDTANVKDVKRAFRKLMSQHHPDKLAAKGLPPEMMTLAKEKTQQIMAAYELIMSKHR